MSNTHFKTHQLLVWQLRPPGESTISIKIPKTVFDLCLRFVHAHKHHGKCPFRLSILCHQHPFPVHASEPLCALSPLPGTQFPHLSGCITHCSSLSLNVATSGRELLGHGELVTVDFFILLGFLGQKVTGHWDGIS